MWRFGGKYQTLEEGGVGDPTTTAKYKNFVDECLAPICKVQELADWYRVSQEDLERVGKKALVQRGGGLIGTCLIY